MHKPPLLLAALLLAGCAASSATVVSSTGGPSMAEAQRESASGPKPRIAVSGFAFRAGQGGGDIGSGMSDMLMDSLFNSGKFIVLERARLSDVQDEQALAKEGDFNPATAVKGGELEGAQLLVRGAITQFEPDCKGGSLIVVSAKQACMAINIRIVDAATGRVLNATTVEGTSANKGVGFVFARSDLPIGLGAFSKTPMEQAIRNCIETAVQYIANTKM